jgi:hypothetical protein
MPEPPADDKFLHDLAQQLLEKFKISHATFQVERGDDDHPCVLSQTCAD